MLKGAATVARDVLRPRRLAHRAAKGHALLRVRSLPEAAQVARHLNCESGGSRAGSSSRGGAWGACRCCCRGDIACASEPRTPSSAVTLVSNAPQPCVHLAAVHLRLELQL